MAEVYVFWHKIPDTDAICSSVIFANYLQKKWVDAKACKLGKLNNETKFLFDYLGLEEPETIESLPEWTSVALVDHNEMDQTIDWIADLDIAYVVDHHKFNLQTSSPVSIRAEKLCSTASVLFKMYKEAWFEIDRRIWTLMLSAILSDSLLFKSATSTAEDKKILEELIEITQIMDYEAFMKPLFEAKSDLWDISAEELIKTDYKEFEVNGKKLWVWTLETVNPSYALGRKEEILKWLANIKNSSNLSFIMLSIVDIFWEKNTTIILDWEDSEVIKNVFWTEVVDNLADLWNRLSRKKQIIPDLTAYFSK